VKNEHFRTQRTAAHLLENNMFLAVSSFAH